MCKFGMRDRNKHSSRVVVFADFIKFFKLIKIVD